MTQVKEKAAVATNNNRPAEKTSLVKKSSKM